MNKPSKVNPSGFKIILPWPSILSSIYGPVYSKSLYILIHGPYLSPLITLPKKTNSPDSMSNSSISPTI